MTLEDDLRRAGASLRTTGVDTPPFGVVQRKHRLRVATTTAVAVVVLLGAGGGVALAAHNPHHGVNVSNAPDSSIPSDVTSTSTAIGGATSLVSGTLTIEGVSSRPLQPGVTLPLETIAFVHATIRNITDRPVALVHDGAAVYAVACDNGALYADPAMGPALHPFASTFTGTPEVNITPPLAAGESMNDLTAVVGRTPGTMTCRIVVNGSAGWTPIEGGPSASIEVVPATATTTTTAH